MTKAELLKKLENVHPDTEICVFCFECNDYLHIENVDTSKQNDTVSEYDQLDRGYISIDAGYQD